MDYFGSVRPKLNRSEISEARNESFGQQLQGVLRAFNLVPHDSFPWNFPSLNRNPLQFPSSPKWSPCPASKISFRHKTLSFGLSASVCICLLALTLLPLFQSCFFWFSLKSESSCGRIVSVALSIGVLLPRSPNAAFQDAQNKLPKTPRFVPFRLPFFFCASFRHLLIICFLDYRAYGGGLSGLWAFHFLLFFFFHFFQ